MPKYRDMLLRLAQDPVGQTRVFHLIMLLFFQHVLGVRPDCIESRRGSRRSAQTLVSGAPMVLPHPRAPLASSALWLLSEARSKLRAGGLCTRTFWSGSSCFLSARWSMFFDETLTNSNAIFTSG